MACLLAVSLITQIGAELHLLNNENSQYAAIINIAGKQRMLSQRIAFDLNHLLAENARDFGFVRRDLKASLATFEKAHKKLIDQLDDTSKEIKQIYLDPPYSLDEQSREFINITKQILDREKLPHALKTNDPDVKHINSLAAGQLIVSLDAAVSQLQADAEKGAATERNILFALTILLLFTLIAGIGQFYVIIKRLSENETRLSINQFVFDHSPDGIITADNTGKIISANQAVRDILACESGVVIGKSIFSLLNDLQEYEHTDEKVIISSLNMRGAWRSEVLSVSHFAKDLSIGIRSVYENGQIKSYVALLTDISEQKNAEKEFREKSLRDQMTGLRNRSALYEVLEHEINIAQREKVSFAFMMLDLDGFKSINDTFGHKAGDEVLKKVASRLNSSIRDSDLVARLGGDEFVVVQRNITSLEDIRIMASKLIVEISQPIAWGNDQLSVGTSIGIAIFPDHASTIKDVSHLADMAMYDVKSSGKNQFRIYDPNNSTERVQENIMDANRAAITPATIVVPENITDQAAATI